MVRDYPHLHLYAHKQRSLFPKLVPGYGVDFVHRDIREPAGPERMTYLDAYAHMLRAHELTGLAVVVSAEDGTLIDAITQKPRASWDERFFAENPRVSRAFLDG